MKIKLLELWKKPFVKFTSFLILFVMYKYFDSLVGDTPNTQATIDMLTGITGILVGVLGAYGIGSFVAKILKRSK